MQGVRANQLVGYGLVIGLNGTGDSLRNAPFTEQSLQSMLDRMGINVRNSKARTRNVAAVIVTAELPAFTGKGARIDVTVSSLGDATSLQGGSLILTPLNGADNQIYAVAQGPLAVTGFAQQGKAETVTQGVPTTGRIPNGAHGRARCAGQALRRDGDRVRAAQSGFQHGRQHCGCDQPLHAAALRHQGRQGERPAHGRDGAAVLSVAGAVHCRGRRADGAARMRPARVVIDERTGTIVIGKDVQISTVAVAHGNLTVRVTENAKVSQPNPFARGETVVTPDTQIDVDEKGANLAIIRGTNLQTLVAGLNRIGLKPQGIIAILQAIKSAGALQADLVVQ